MHACRCVYLCWCMHVRHCRCVIHGDLHGACTSCLHALACPGGVWAACLWPASQTQVCARAWNCVWKCAHAARHEHGGRTPRALTRTMSWRPLREASISSQMAHSWSNASTSRCDPVSAPGPMRARASCPLVMKRFSATAAPVEVRMHMHAFLLW